MAGTVIHKIRSPVKRVEFKVKHTTRGTHYKQSILKTKTSPLRTPTSKRNLAANVDDHFEGGFNEPLIQHKGKVSFLTGSNK